MKPPGLLLLITAAFPCILAGCGGVIEDPSAPYFGHQVSYHDTDGDGRIDQAWYIRRNGEGDRIFMDRNGDGRYELCIFRKRNGAIYQRTVDHPVYLDRKKTLLNHADLPQPD